MHASSNDDTRYIMMNADAAFASFVDRVREKFGIRTRFKLKVRDEGDLITMGDADDWAMAVEGVRRELEASEAGGEMGKMEVCLLLRAWWTRDAVLIGDRRSGYRKCYDWSVCYDVMCLLMFGLWDYMSWRTAVVLHGHDGVGGSGLQGDCHFYRGTVRFTRLLTTHRIQKDTDPLPLSYHASSISSLSS